ncbi:MAG: family 16 glycosylhydrolase [Flavobacteriaceae bacterium]
MKIYYKVCVLIFFISSLTYGQQMPIDFSESNHNFTGFSGSSSSIQTDPQDGNNAVGQFANDGSASFQGLFLDLNQPVDFDNEKNITLRFYAFDPNNHTIIVKFENGTNADVEVNMSVPSPSANTWKDITFDFSNAQLSSNGTPINATGTYNKITIFIDGGSNTPGTYLIDDINDGSVPTDPNALDVIYNDLVWEDNFDVDGAVDSNKWHHQTFGPNGGQWFNGELQHYTDSQTNSFVSGGFLNIVAKRETVTQNGVTLDFSSARLNSKYAFTYGRVDVRAKLPSGNGTWPAIWTLGKNISEPGAYWETQGFGTTGWPACGEIDIMEHGLHATNEVSSAIHTPSSSGATVNTDTQMLADVANDFHIYSMNWSPDQITFLIDGVGYYTYKPSVQDNATWPFDLDQFLLLNVAIGGFSGTPDPSFTESSMVIDYVKVYQNTSLSIDEVFASKFSIYPNPSSEVINISTNETIDKVELFNVLGQRIISKKTNNKQLMTTEVKSGLYLLKIYSGSKSVTKKVVIK